MSSELGFPSSDTWTIEDVEFIRRLFWRFLRVSPAYKFSRATRSYHHLHDPLYRLLRWPAHANGVQLWIAGIDCVRLDLGRKLGRFPLAPMGIATGREIVRSGYGGKLGLGD